MLLLIYISNFKIKFQNLPFVTWAVTAYPRCSLVTHKTPNCMVITWRVRSRLSKIIKKLIFFNCVGNGKVFLIKYESWRPEISQFLSQIVTWRTTDIKIVLLWYCDFQKKITEISLIRFIYTIIIEQSLDRSNKNMCFSTKSYHVEDYKQVTIALK